MNKLIRVIRHLVHELVVFILPKSLLKKLLSCEEVSKILVEDSKLKKSTRVKLHILICQCCTDYKHQLEVIDKSSKKLNTLKLSQKEMDKINASKRELIEKFKK